MLKRSYPPGTPSQRGGRRTKKGAEPEATAVEGKGSGGSINFNPDYILEALRQSDLDEIRLDIKDDSMPAKFTLGESFTYVVMPISGA